MSPKNKIKKSIKQDRKFANNPEAQDLAATKNKPLFKSAEDNDTDDEEESYDSSENKENKRGRKIKPSDDLPQTSTANNSITEKKSKIPKIIKNINNKNKKKL